MIVQVLCDLSNVAVSTSSVVGSQMRWFFLMRYIFMILTMMKDITSLECLYYLFFHMSTSMQHNGFAQ